VEENGHGCLSFCSPNHCSCCIDILGEGSGERGVMQSSVGVCELCGRGDIKRNFHHLICRTVHRNKYFRKRFSKEEMQKRGLWLCQLCHRGIHEIFTDEKILSKEYNTRELLLENGKIKEHLLWVRKQKGYSTSKNLLD